MRVNWDSYSARINIFIPSSFPSPSSLSHISVLSCQYPWTNTLSSTSNISAPSGCLPECLLCRISGHRTPDEYLAQHCWGWRWCVVFVLLNSEMARLPLALAFLIESLLLWHASVELFERCERCKMGRECLSTLYTKFLIYYYWWSLPFATVSYIKDKSMSSVCSP